MRRFLLFLLFLIGVSGVGAYFAFFMVHQTEQALVLEFGKIKKVLRTPGLYWKIPFVQTVSYFDKRILDLDTSPQEVIVSGQKRLIVDSFARYKIIDPLLFFQTVQNEGNVGSRLGTILDSSLRSVLGSATFTDVVRDQRAVLMADITMQLNAKAKDFGIEVLDVRLKRADLPEANSEAIYSRMKTERQREAAEIRAEGEEQARRIRADGDRQVTVLKANATRDSEKIRGDGDAKRNAIFADAFGRDPDFFAFYRSMQAYEAGLGSNDTRLVLTPDTEFFRYFNDPAGKSNRAAEKKR